MYDMVWIFVIPQSSDVQIQAMILGGRAIERWSIYEEGDLMKGISVLRETVYSLCDVR